METYKVNINWTNKCALRVSDFIFIIASVGFVILFIINIPLRFVPKELSLPYYFDFLPKGIFKLLGLTIASFIVSLVIGSIRQNSLGLLKISKKIVIIESKKRCDIISFNEIKRISLLEKSWLSFPYRIEFIYPDYSFKRVAVKKKEDYQCILKILKEKAPENFEFYEAENHSVEYFKGFRRT